MFRLKSACDMKSIAFDGSTLVGWKDSDSAKIIDIQDDGIYCEIEDFIMDTAARGVCMTGASSVFLFDFIIRNMRQIGVGVCTDSIAVGAIDAEVGNFENCAVGVNLGKGVGWDIYFSGLRFLCGDPAQVGINYDGTNFGYSFFRADHCDHNFVGTFMQGFDFSIARDANIDILDCNNFPENNPRIDLEVFDATADNATQMPSETGVWKKLILPTPVNSLKKFSWDGVNRVLEYLSDYMKGGTVLVSGTIHTSSSPRSVEIALFQNPGDGEQPVGTPVAHVLVRTTATNVPFVVSSNASVETVSKGDKFQFWVRSPSHTNFGVTVEDLNLHVELR